MGMLVRSRLVTVGTALSTTDACFLRDVGGGGSVRASAVHLSDMALRPAVLARERDGSSAITEEVVADAAVPHLSRSGGHPDVW
jgi:hypothetical protein